MIKRVKKALAIGTLGLTALVGGVAKADVIVPIVGSVRGAQNSVFKSDLKLYNPTDSTISGTIILTERNNAQSSDNPSLAYTLGPRQTLTWENIYDAIKPGAEGAGRLIIVPDAGIDPLVSTNTYTKLENGGELGQVPTPFTPEELYSNTTLAGIVQKAGQRHNSFIMTGPAGATVEYTARNPANGQTFTTSATYAPNATYQLIGGAIPNLPHNSSLEVKIISGSARYAGNNVDNTTNQGAWEDYKAISTTVPKITGIDRDGDGDVDMPDANGDNVIDGVINVSCTTPFPWEGTLVVEPKGNYNFTGHNLPQGMTYTQDKGKITYSPPCTTQGSNFTPGFTVTGNDHTPMLVTFRVN